jgi:threonine aldolase
LVESIAVDTIDLRSDTVTRPTAAMRETMATAEVGDDVYEEDPTVNQLQETAAQLVGMEAALFVASGTMGNQVAIAAHTRPGDVVLVGEFSHIVLDESGAPAALWGVQIETIGEGGLFSGSDVIRAILPDDIHHAPVRLLAVENTHMGSGGRVFPQDQLDEAAGAARERGLAVHLDGARLFNAAIATGAPTASLAEPFDSLTFCLSKGLGAPVGSVVCGSADFITNARRARKQMGGGMRQIGIIAAAGLYALEHHVERLAEDHANAQRLAVGLEKMGLHVDPFPETNIVLFSAEDTPGFLRETRARGVLILPITETELRAVTHLDVSEADVDDALDRISEVVESGVR